jgi:hypothetical protein
VDSEKALYLRIYIFTYMQFKQLELKSEDSRLKRTLNSAHFKRTLIAVAIGALIGFSFFYFTEGRLMESIPGIEILKSMGIGAFFGLFMTNSPCARGRC